jgi:hypothetical protein
MTGRLHEWSGPWVGWSFLLMLLIEPILWSLPDQVSARAPDEPSLWVMGAVGAGILVRIFAGSALFSDPLLAGVTIRETPSPDRVQPDQGRGPSTDV